LNYTRETRHSRAPDHHRPPWATGAGDDHPHLNGDGAGSGEPSAQTCSWQRGSIEGMGLCHAPTGYLHGVPGEFFFLTFGGLGLSLIGFTGLIYALDSRGSLHENAIALWRVRSIVERAPSSPWAACSSSRCSASSKTPRRPSASSVPISWSPTSSIFDGACGPARRGLTDRDTPCSTSPDSQ